jgi:hypothetical protein
MRPDEFIGRLADGDIQCTPAAWTSGGGPGRNLHSFGIKRLPQRGDLAQHRAR